MTKKTTRIALVVIVLVAALLRLQHVSSHDLNNDEALNGARSAQWFDFFGSDNQTSPVQWFEERRWWQGLSFHDHPPLGFALQFVSMRIVGDSTAALRLPFALIGVASVYMMYLLAKELFKKESYALVAAGFMAVMPLAVWISRLALFDGMVVLFIIVSWWAFLKMETQPRYVWVWSASCALALLTKYTFVCMMAFFGFFILVRRRQLLKQARFWYAVIVGAAMLAPVALYNIMVFRTRGHFDAALSSMLGMKHTDFALIADRAKGFHFELLVDAARILVESQSALVMLLALGGIVIASFTYMRDKTKQGKAEEMMMVAMLLLCGMFLFLSSERHFLTLWAPLLTLCVTYVFIACEHYAQEHPAAQRRILIAAWIVVALTGVLGFPQYTTGSMRGHAELYKLVDNEFAGAVPKLGFQVWDDPQVIEFQNARVDTPAGFGGVAHVNEAFMVVDDRLDWVAKFWISIRYLTHGMLPMFDTTSLATYLTTQRTTMEAMVRAGWKTFYFVEVAQAPQTQQEKESQEVFSLLREGVKEAAPGEIIESMRELYTPQGELMFKVYKLEL